MKKHKSTTFTAHINEKINLNMKCNRENESLSTNEHHNSKM